ncbi:MAG: hypothetical protein K6T30_07025 [Alicyclobacillus sp.]|nr:hypothetical protein [Alicyclobacillus sp.]
MSARRSRARGSAALTHIGQLATLRRLAGAPMPQVSYLRAEIQAGRISPEA